VQEVAQKSKKGSGARTEEEKQPEAYRRACSLGCLCLGVLENGPVEDVVKLVACSMHSHSNTLKRVSPSNLRNAYSGLAIDTVQRFLPACVLASEALTRGSGGRPAQTSRRKRSRKRRLRLTRQSLQCDRHRTMPYSTAQSRQYTVHSIYAQLPWLAALTLPQEEVPGRGA